ncbi:failed axon connections-like [Limulus polyphemus]|uniref:Failed axon connections-like n=1 Tax=Limulus polyphemus TaxID=6850 RepID=A0ABM1BHV9_LIMPO|nr:failed axon connections-like [Limulus polyphemus]
MTSTETETTSNSADQANTETKGDIPSTQSARSPPSVHKTDYEKDTVYLYQFVRCPVLPSLSPFCLKVETWLRMTGLKYENVDHRLKFKSKKGQLPFVELNGVEIADSDIIISELSKQFDKDLDEDLTVDQKNISHAFNSMLNNHTSWVMRWWRYSHPGQFLKTAQLDVKQAVNSALPKSIIQFFFKMSFRSNIKKAVGHGLGRHSREEILQFGKDDLKVLSEYLQDKPFFFGNEPHLLDCVAFSHLCQFYFVSFGDMKEYMDSDCANLVSFLERMKERYWPDWEEMTGSLELNTHLPKKKLEKEEEEKEKKENEIDTEEKDKEGKKDIEEKEKEEKLTDIKEETPKENPKEESEKKE